jgi:hypothetical protein
MEGWNDSGLGSRSGGADGIRKYCCTKRIVAERVTRKRSRSGIPTAARRARLSQPCSG